MGQLPNMNPGGEQVMTWVMKQLSESSQMSRKVWDRTERKNRRSKWCATEKESYDGGLNKEEENKYLESQKHKMSRITET